MHKITFDGNISILKNGIRLVTIKKNSQLAALHIGVKIGSLYENNKEKGISHFIEHMLFKGTIKRSNEEINQALEERGGEYNAYTDYHSTVYSMTCLQEEMESSLEVLSDMILNSNFSSKELEVERGVILAEIRTSKDDVEDFSFKRIHELAFRTSSVRYDISGEEELVKNYTREDLWNFYKRYYVPNNCYVTLVSSMEHQEAVTLIEKYMGDWKAEKLAHPEIFIENNIPGTHTTYKKNIEQSTIVYAYTFHNLDKREELALKILNHKLGESANALLFRRLREERGLAYDVYSQTDMSRAVKTLYIYTAVEKNKVKEAIETINTCIRDIINKEVLFDINTVNLMKKVLKTAVVSILEDSTDLSNYVLHQVIDEESIYEYMEDLENMESITSEELYKVAEKVFKEPTIHILLPKKEG